MRSMVINMRGLLRKELVVFLRTAFVGIVVLFVLCLAMEVGFHALINELADPNITPEEKVQNDEMLKSIISLVGFMYLFIAGTAQDDVYSGNKVKSGDRLVSSLPISGKDVVLSHYSFLLIIQLLGMLMSAVFFTFGAIIGLFENPFVDFSVICIVLSCIYWISHMIIQPIALDKSKAQFSSVVVIGLPMLLVVGSIATVCLLSLENGEVSLEKLFNIISWIDDKKLYFLAVTGTLAVVLTPVSIRLAIKAYNKGRTAYIPEKKDCTLSEQAHVVERAKEPVKLMQRERIVSQNDNLRVIKTLFEIWWRDKRLHIILVMYAVITIIIQVIVRDNATVATAFSMMSIYFAGSLSVGDLIGGNAFRKQLYVSPVGRDRLVAIRFLWGNIITIALYAFAVAVSYIVLLLFGIAPTGVYATLPVIAVILTMVMFCASIPCTCLLNNRSAKVIEVVWVFVLIFGVTWVLQALADNETVLMQVVEFTTGINALTAVLCALGGVVLAVALQLVTWLGTRSLHAS